ncbi:MULTISPECIES: FadR/GntR family transcriptional regulator [Micrococcaceae]|uniref:Transcriptional regulator, GntR family n=1 Tax=Arthrobacter rhombi TaxID=71253 RepID=A0A1R4EU35_9MICC|nr:MULTISPECIES: FCD domain-containing protein [Micrococcaceae]PCC24480.1 FadR family transcriptional regulator [Glutamicibacter sp. BW78]SJM47168.1 Transcriptional regulator, GntR family [Arthrobacter rhombi]
MQIPSGATVLQEPIVETLGREIIDGVLSPGDRLTLEALQSRFGVSRTVMRDCMRVLESLRLVYPKRRIGLVVQESRFWNAYDRRVIRWRLAGPGRERQFTELTELRVAVEPLAAAGAARRATAQAREEITSLAQQLRSLGEAGELEKFLAVDIAFHSLLLRASGNSMFAELDGVVAEVLSGRTHQGMMPFHPREEALAEHEAVAAAVADADGPGAERHMQVLVDEVRAALEHRLHNGQLPD